MNNHEPLIAPSLPEVLPIEKPISPVKPDKNSPWSIPAPIVDPIPKG